MLGHRHRRRCILSHFGSRGIINLVEALLVKASKVGVYTLDVNDVSAPDIALIRVTQTKDTRSTADSIGTMHPTSCGHSTVYAKYECLAFVTVNAGWSLLAALPSSSHHYRLAICLSLVSPQDVVPHDGCGRCNENSQLCIDARLRVLLEYSADATFNIVQLAEEAIFPHTMSQYSDILCRLGGRGWMDGLNFFFRKNPELPRYS